MEYVQFSPVYIVGNVVNQILKFQVGTTVHRKDKVLVVNIY